MNVTLYGPDEETYAGLCHYPGGFERTLRGVRLLREHGVDVRLGFSITKENAPHLARMHAIADALQVPVNVDSYMLPATRERERPFALQVRLLPEDAARVQEDAIRRKTRGYAEQARQRLAWMRQHAARPAADACMTCMAGRCSFAVNWQGMLRPCVILNRPQADVFALGFAQAWAQVCGEVDAIRTSSACAACPLRALCQTCAASALYETGALNGKPEYLCRMTKETLRLLEEAAGSQMAE